MSDLQNCYKSLRKKMFLLVLIGSALCAFIFATNMLPYIGGILIGFCLAMIALFSIMKMSTRIVDKENPKRIAYQSYIVRYIGNGVVMYVAMSRGINIFAMLFGFLTLKVAIYWETMLDKEVDE